MPKLGFKYPDGTKVSLNDVRERKVDIEKMGVALPTLLHMSEQRDSNRKPSTTELLIGTCQAYLQRTVDYYENPQDNAFSLAGTIHHSKLEDFAVSGMEAELKLEYKGITGILDLYDKETRTLIDYKNTGSYKASQILGIQSSEKLSETEVYKKNGRWGKAGTPKKIKVFYQDKGTANFGDWLWQLNFYRLMLEKSGNPVDKMCIQMTIRDGGIMVATSRGVYKNIYLVDVPFINNEVLEERFLDKKEKLLKSLENKEMPSMCSAEETWNGNKCKNYCTVRDFCPYIRA